MCEISRLDLYRQRWRYFDKGRISEGAAFALSCSLVPFLFAPFNVRRVCARLGGALGRSIAKDPNGAYTNRIGR